MMAHGPPRLSTIVSRRKPHSNIMGVSLSWLAVKGKSPETVRNELQLRCTGVPGEIPKSSFVGSRSDGGWYLIVARGCEHRIIGASVIKRLSVVTNTIGLLAASTGLTHKELATLAVAPGPVEQELWFYQTGESQRAAKLFGEKLQFYVWGRLGGHTKGFLLSTLTNGSSIQTADPDLRALLSQRPELPGRLLERSGSGFYTNEHEKVFRTAKYCFADGEIAWCYDFCLTRDGTAFDICELKVDAQECDPKLSTVFQAVDTTVSAEMREKGISRRFGSVHSFWRMKKEKLKAKGITWRSPPELNPGIIFD
jgi:hypothetical protein